MHHSTIIKSILVLLTFLQCVEINAQDKLSYELNVGNSINYVDVHDPNNYLEDFGISGITFGFSVESQLKNNFYYRGNARVTDYWIGYTFNQTFGDIIYRGLNYSQAFWGFEIDLEGGYTVTNSNNFVIANFGVSISNGIVPIIKGFQASSGYKADDPENYPDLISEYSEVEYVDKNWMLSLGVHLSRKFYVYKNLYVPISINYNYGLRRAYRTDFRYTMPSLNSPINGNSYLKGTRLWIEGGIGITID